MNERGKILLNKVNPPWIKVTNGIWKMNKMLYFCDQTPIILFGENFFHMHENQGTKWQSRNILC